MTKLKRFGYSVFGSVLILILWGVASHFHWVSKIFLPTPWEVVRAFGVGIQDGSLLLDVRVTAVRFIIAFLIAVGLGTPIGLLMGSIKRVYYALQFLVEFFRSIPTTALFPLFILFFGIGDLSKIAVAVWGAGLIVIVNTMHGVHQVKRLRLLVAENLKLTRLQTFWHVIFPDALPSIVSGYRIALSITLVIVVVTEMFIGSRNGIGLRIMNAQLVYNTADMFAAILTVGLFGFLVNKVVQITEEKLVHWKGR